MPQEQGSKISATERIAVALLGWKFKNDHAPEFTSYGRDEKVAWVLKDGRFSLQMREAGWPDFTTLDGVRLAEDALGVMLKDWHYMCALHDVRGTRAAETQAEAILRATAEQRVAAIIRVLDEAEI